MNPDLEGFTAGYIYSFVEGAECYLPSDLKNIWLDGWKLASKDERLTEWFYRVTRQREKNILARDIEWRVESRHGMWSTARIDAVERMGPELLSYWTTDPQIGPNYCPGCGKAFCAILGEADDCVHCEVWWCSNCIDNNKRELTNDGRLVPKRH